MEASKAAYHSVKHRHAIHARVMFGFVAKRSATKNDVGLLDIRWQEVGHVERY